MCILILPYEQSLGKSCRDVDFEFVQWTNKKTSAICIDLY